MINLKQYYMGHDFAYSSELTSEKKACAAETVKRVNELIVALQAGGVTTNIKQTTGSELTSGWRPLSVNANTPHAAPNSKHTLCQAADLYDPDGEIDDWAINHPEVLEKIGLWQEHPASTKGWAHFQTVAPRSGHRVFYP